LGPRTARRRPDRAYADAGPSSAKLLKNGTIETYKGFSHGISTTAAATINADLLA
jgi:non-heme chloroperoxidase